MLKYPKLTRSTPLQKTQNIGIDLGTCNSCVAEFKNGVASALVNNITKELTTPSYVTYGDQIKIGQSEKDNPTSQSISSFKRLIGRRFTDTEVQEHIKRVQYKIINQNESPLIQLANQIISPTQVSSEFLKQLKQQTEFKTNNVVLTVPAYFSHSQKLETERAGQLAGLTIQRLLAEPTAAALQYNQLLKQSIGNEKIMVLDLGAGTFDVSVLDKVNDVYSVLAAAGNNFYGGDDYTDVIMQICKRKNIEVKFKDAELLKHELSAKQQVEVQNQTITRREADEAYAQLDEKMDRPILQTLSDANLECQQINKVLLVGGQTRQPSVQNRIEQLMKQKPLTTLHPDLCVAQGASIQAAILNKQLNSVLLLDATPFSLGIETMGGAFSRVINRNATLPVCQKQVFTTTMDNQESVSIKIYQGDNQLAAQNILIGEFELTGIGKQPRGVPRIEVGFEIDQNGVVRVSAVDLKSGAKKDIKVRFGQQRAEQKSEAEVLSEVLRGQGVKLSGKEDLKKLKAMKARLDRRAKAQ